MCSIFSCLTVGVPEDGGRREKVLLRLMGEEVCKEAEEGNNEGRGRRRATEEERREWARQRNV